MCNMTNGEAITASDLLQTLADKSMSASAALAIRRVLRELHSHLVSVEAERNAIVDRHVAHDENGEMIPDGKVKGRYLLKEGHGPLLDEEMKALFAAPCVVMHPIKATELAGLPPVTPDFLLGLGAVVDDEC